ncbi:formylglycine-generating enzyme family protein [Ralstonia solanacearum]|nr:formylglycine-generating enzyme family protein [Ralstonia solanacearum]
MIIPSGDFMMGATKEEFSGFMDRYSVFYSNETPLHKVHVQEFALAKADVTRAQCSVFVKDTGFKAKGCQVYDGKTAHFDENADWRNSRLVKTEDDPVVCVSWNEAKRYIGWLNKKLHKQSHVVYRLPTEAEWEYAARAGTAGKTYWADTKLDACKFANVRDQSVNVVDPSAPHVECNDGFVYTSPVGIFAPNSWGLFDMLGNVYQWVEDMPACRILHASARRCLACETELRLTNPSRR